MVNRRWVIFALAVAGAAFLMLLPFPAGQQQIFPHTLLCDYRVFISPVVASGVSYVSPSAVLAKDACYPPIAYDLMSFFFGAGQSVGRSLAPGEIGIVLSVLLFQIAGLLCLLPEGGRRRLLLVPVVMLTPAFICPLLRANPVGWSFGLVCFFLKWYDSPRRGQRIFAACSLALAAALKISPCLYGVLYICVCGREGVKIDCKGVIGSAVLAAVLVFVPFCWHGGTGAFLQWLSNAGLNAAHYSLNDPIWGFVPFATRFTASNPDPTLVQAMNVLTRFFALCLVLATPFCRERYQKLMFLGSAMAFLTYHDYGALYLLPAFFAWLETSTSATENRYRVVGLILGIAWLMILMPLQIWNPLNGSLNESLQGEAHLLLLAFVIIDAMTMLFCRRGSAHVEM